VQKGLQRKGVYEGRIDGVFGPRSLRALLRFQESALGRGASDGVCGPQTATALGITWP
jgi:peptidoglycan hydrolase-like protein with peptidoglycan-binding domain